MDCSDAYTLTKETLYVECNNCGHKNVFENDTDTFADIFGCMSKATFNCKRCGSTNSVHYTKVRII